MEVMAVRKEVKEPFSIRLFGSMIADLEDEAESQNRTVANLIDTMLQDFFIKNRPLSRTALAAKKKTAKQKK